MRLVITGANSFIGQHLLKYINGTGFDKENEVICITRYPFKIDNIIFRNINASLSEYEFILSKVYNCDVLIHLAWYGTRGTNRNNFIEQDRAYIESLRGIKSCIANGCKKILLAGSQAEYGPCNDIITEETECKPNTWYGKKKLQLYNETKILCKKNDAKVIDARFFSLYGVGDYPGTMIMSSIVKMLNNESCNYTLSEQSWDYLNVRDAVSALYMLIRIPSTEGIYNFASGKSTQLKNYILDIKKILHSESVLNFGAVPYPITGKVSLNPQINRLKQLQWSAKVSFVDGIREIVESMDK